jgi:sugar diacid utilization regulator
MERARTPDSAATPDLAEVFERVATRVHVVGSRPSAADLADLRSAGARAAEHGATVGEAVDLYLATTASLGADAREPSSPDQDTGGLLEVLRRAVPALVDGYQSARRTMMRLEETARVEFVDDLLRGDTDVASMLQRGEGFGLDLSASHQVVLVAPRASHLLEPLDEGLLGRAVREIHGHRDVLVTTRDGQLVAVLPARSTLEDVDAAARTLHQAMSRSSPRTPWRAAAGRPQPGVYGVARSYRQAREAVQLVERLHPDRDLVPSRDLLIYRVLGRDRVALADLVESALRPLTGARGGVEPLLATLEAYFACGATATEAARQLHVSVRTVTYRLARIAQLTGYDPTDPTQRLTLHTAVVGARLLPWPEPPDPPALQ